MAVVVKESVESLSYTQDADRETVERVFFLHGIDNPYEARTYGPQKGDAYGGLVVVGRKTEVVQMVSGNSDGIVKLVCTYQTPDKSTPPPSTDSDYEWSVSTGNEKVIRPCRGQTHYPSTEAFDAIGDNGDGDIEGVNIIVPAPTMQFKKTFTSWNSTLMGVIVAATGKINQYPWKNWAAGEVLFAGASGSRKGYGPLVVTYNFMVSKSATISVETLAGGTQSVVKQGHDYLWYRTKAKIDGGKTVRAIDSAHVAKVYELYNFATLGLGA